jgi:hypothetical protein
MQALAKRLLPDYDFSSMLKPSAIEPGPDDVPSGGESAALAQRSRVITSRASEADRLP